ncbi:hypothetical protein BU25DRAFT_412942 [Macroventuria anomochaeta]|uniref:Uncharacterized protein n=1 Tax=Macroventuria anomochaeta TaxID=301207 RepID=A0ACB6RTN2_9PLEO|nr:uncharacterized protein BU25DRAFT_412942 [Macroventuria anomochaeta]KAF2625143.1 hypothetical protein BU25DRAFT_412942 [Macroventuria anomochaeta]
MSHHHSPATTHPQSNSHDSLHHAQCSAPLALAIPTIHAPLHLFHTRTTISFPTFPIQLHPYLESDPYNAIVRP